MCDMHDVIETVAKSGSLGILWYSMVLFFSSPHPPPEHRSKGAMFTVALAPAGSLSTLDPRKSVGNKGCSRLMS